MRFTRFILWLLIVAVLYYGYQYKDAIIGNLSSITHGNKDSAGTIIERHEQTVQDKIAEESSPSEKTNPTSDNVVNKAAESKSEEEAKKPSLLEQEKSVMQQGKRLEEKRKTKEQGAQQNAPTTNPQTEAKTPSAQNEMAQLHAKAKQAIRNKEPAVALRAYHTLLRSQPKQPVVWGELGDLYHSMGETTQASKAYGNAMLLFQKQGNTAIAKRLLSYITEHAPEVAQRLQQH